MVAFVQAASNTAASGSVTVTLGSNTTATNCLDACIALGTASSLASVASVKLGGVADNFAQLKAVGDLTTGAEQLANWADPNCAGGQTAVAITLNVAQATLAWVLEFSGVATSSVLDQSATFDSAAGTNSTFSVTSGTTTVAAEVAVGCVYGFNTTITGPSSPWVNESTVTSGTRTLQASYNILSSTQTVTYSGSFGAAQFNGQILVTLKGAAAAAPSGTVQPLATFPTLRRRLSRAVVNFVPVTTINTGHGPAGTVQPLATVPVPRRRPSRVVTGFVPVTTINTGHGPAGTVQPYAAQPAPRRRPARASVQFVPVKTTNPAPTAPPPVPGGGKSMLARYMKWADL